MIPTDPCSPGWPSPSSTQAYLSSPTGTVSSGISVGHGSWASRSASGSSTLNSPASSAYSGFDQAAVSLQSSLMSQMQPQTSGSAPAPQAFVPRPPHNPSKYIALATQYIFVAPERTPMLARVSMTDYRGNAIIDTFVLPSRPVMELRTHVTGLQAEYFGAGVPDLQAVRDRVSSLINGKVIVGHSLWTDLSLLGLRHPAIDTRDVALFLPFHRTLRCFTTTPLKSLVSHLMRRKIGQEVENPLEDARAALDLFRSYEDAWEDEIRIGSWPCALPPSSFKKHFT